LAFDAGTKTGVYILHSAPNYPAVLSDNTINSSLPDNTWEYGQHFYCVSLDETSLATVVTNLQVIYPVVYAQTGTFNQTSFEDSLLMQQVQTFSLVDGEVVTILSKSPNYTTGFLYEDIIQPYFQLELYVESWGRPYQPPICPGNSTYETLNIDYVQFDNGDGWDHYSDHSKWAVAPGNQGIACACDMNRMDSQSMRGGSCICMTNPVFYSAMAGIVQTVDQC
jgi:hypothetical protein